MKKYLFFLWISTAQAAGVIAEVKTPTVTISLMDFCQK
jgi:hypothetical protein